MKRGRRQERPLPATAERDRLPAAERFDRTQQPQLEAAVDACHAVTSAPS